MGHGYYSALVAFPDSFTGELRWDTGTGTFASEIINPGSDENLDIKVSSVVGSIGTGAFTVTVTVTDTLTNPIPNAHVRMTQGVNTYVAVTSLSGVSTFALDAATYTLGIAAQGYQFTPVSVSITNNANFFETMTSIVIPAPSNPILGNVFGTFIDLEGNPMAGLSFTFTLQVPTPAKSGMIFAERVTTASTNSSGQLTDVSGNTFVSLARNDGITPSGSHYLVVCRPANLNNKFQLNSPTFDLASLIN